jgi:putative FmdB family regulatory protein
MPTYEHRCKKCDKLFSIQMTISDYEKRKSIKCPNCKSASVKRIFSSFSVVTSSKS